MFNIIRYVKNNLNFHSLIIDNKKITKTISTASAMYYETYSYHVNGFDIFLSFIKQSDISTTFCHTYVLFNDALVANNHSILPDSFKFSKKKFIYNYMYKNFIYYKQLDSYVFSKMLPSIETIVYGDLDNFNLRKNKHYFNLHTYFICYNNEKTSLLIGTYKDDAYKNAGHISNELKFTDDSCKALSLIRYIEQVLQWTDSEVGNLKRHGKFIIDKPLLLESVSKSSFILYFKINTTASHIGFESFINIMWHIDSNLQTSFIETVVINYHEEHDCNVLFDESIELKIDFNNLNCDLSFQYYRIYFLDYIKQLTLMYMPTREVKSLLDIPFETNTLTKEDVALLEMIEI
jgi:hypothetical protein